MTSLTFGSTNHLHRHAIVFFIPDIIMKFFINTIELISLSIIIIELNICLPMTIDTPAHTKVSKLLYFIHILYISMAGLALLLTYFYMLCMIKINMIR